MATIYSSDLKLSIMATGENAGTWGQITNTNLYLIQQAIGGYESISIAGGAQTTALTMSNGAISNARNAVIKLTGTITGNQIVTIPNGIEKTYIVSNGTTGAFTVEFKTASGTGPTFSTTDKGIKILFADGTNVVDVNANFSASSFPQINDSNGNEEIKFTTTASAVNELTIANAAAGNGPSISATGDDTNISLTITPKGTGDLNVDADTLRVGDSNADATITTNGTGDITISTNSGTNSGTVKIFDGVNGNIEITPNGTGVVKLDGLSYPIADGTSGQVLQTNGSAVLSFATINAGTPTVNTYDTGTAVTYTKPTTANWIQINVWGGGGSGGKGSSTVPSGGGGGGAYNTLIVPFSYLVGAVTYTVGAGGASQTSANANGNAGGTTSVSIADYNGTGLTKTISAFGGGGGAAASAGGGGGGGGGIFSVGTGTGTSTAGVGGSPLGGNGVASIYGGGGGGNAETFGSTSIFGGGGGGGGIDGPGTATINFGGNSYYGGGGGGGAANSVTGGNGGTSIYGGGGSNGTIDSTVSSAGTTPAGGSGGTEGGNSGVGGSGRVQFIYW